MIKINAKQLCLKIFIPTIAFSLLYLLIGSFSSIPQLLLFCILGTAVLIPMEIAILLNASKKEIGSYSFKITMFGQEQLPAWKILLISLIFSAWAGLLSAFVSPIENEVFGTMRDSLLSFLPTGFDWTDYGYLKSFPKPMLIITCVYYGIFNVLIAPITEELYFRGYLTSHYQKQSVVTPILITILFSLYHFWLPFNNLFRILAFLPIAIISYRKKNLLISICFHCICNLFSTIGFTLAVLG